jgi:hypothetical protein
VIRSAELSDATRDVTTCHAAASARLDQVVGSTYDGFYMPSVLISLQIPSLRIRETTVVPAKHVDNRERRFKKTVELPDIPKRGDIIEMTAAEETLKFRCTVTMTEWNERANMFVVFCSYSDRSITAADYEALLASPDWVVKPLL